MSSEIGIPQEPNKDGLIQLARAAAAKFLLRPELVCAVVEQESGWDPWAFRYESAFRARYVAPLHLPPTEEIARSCSWGLPQLMGQCARELGYTGAIPALMDPATALEWGCRLLVRKFRAAGGDARAALQLWNGGANPNYASEVLARVPKYLSSHDAPPAA